MIKLDFKKCPVYTFKILDENQRCIYSGFINSKSWYKIVETQELWEYIPENGRVVDKDIQDYQIVLKNIVLDNHTLFINLSKKASIQNKQSIIKEKNQVLSVLEQLEKTLYKRKEEMPSGSYTTSLFEKGEEKILKKFGEEAVEVILAHDDKNELIYESADLIYHLMVLYAYKNMKFQTVLDELKKRMDK